VGLSSSRLLYLACTILLAVLALVPDAPACRWLDLCLAPTRVLGELSSPIGWLQRGGVRAAERTLQDAAAAEHGQSRELADDERLFALPDEDALIQGRRFVHAQVLQRFPDAPDRIECALEEDAAADLEPGQPVVLSNSYVGRVYSVDRTARRVTVHLVTDKDFRVGARVFPADGPAASAASEPGQAAASNTEPAATLAPTGSVAMVVGGLAATRAGGTPLAVHNPDRQGGVGELSGIARVDEGLNPRAPFQGQSTGFRLGTLSVDEHGRASVIPEIDFAEGLFRVVVVLEPKPGVGPAHDEPDVFAAAHWRESRVFGAFEPAASREGLKIDYPLGAGSRERCAVVAGARLVGFIARAGPLHSDVALLGDRGTTVPAQASVEGVVEPLVLGRLVSLGREGPGAKLRFLWSPQPSQALAGSAKESGADSAAAGLAARLFTGAGELGVPRGLVIGETRLPSGPGPHVIEVEESVDPRLLRRLWVWRGEDAVLRGSERAP
jgi:hypothetical protein